MNLIPKEAVLYVFKPHTQYTCSDCGFFLAEMQRCALFGPDDVVLPLDACGLWVKGEPGTFIQITLGGVTPIEAGLSHSNFGFSCKRCEYYQEIGWSCRKVDKDSIGDTPGMIHPDACCNGWEANPGEQLPTEAFNGNS